MMRLQRPLRPSGRRARPASVVPMINIVFLLLIFFLMTATIAPPDPLPVSLPLAGGQPLAPGEAAVLHVGADGTLAFGALRGEAVFGGLAALPEGTALSLRADAGLDGAGFAGLLAQLAEAGVGEVSVVVVAP